jgi:hypothetical protein
VCVCVCVSVWLSVCLSVCVSPYYQLDWVLVLQMRYFLFGKKIELVFCALIGIGIRMRLKLLRIATMGTGALYFSAYKNIE